MLRKFATLTVLIAATASLGGCGDTRRALGLDKRTPDEFRVVARAPLDVPPEYGLRPPQPGAPRPNEATPRDTARAAVFGDKAQPVQRGGGRSSGENALLRAAKADQAQANIRATVNRETQQLGDADRSLVDKLLFWRDAPPPGTVVDPAAEAQRLRENAALGKPSTDGQTPVIERKKGGLLEGLF